MTLTLSKFLSDFLINVGIGIISGDIVAFFNSLALKSFVGRNWYLYIGIFGLLLILFGILFRVSEK